MNILRVRSFEIVVSDKVSTYDINYQIFYYYRSHKYRHLQHLNFNGTLTQFISHFNSLIAFEIPV